MVKKIAAVAGGVLIGLAIAFARVGAFPFWGSDSDSSQTPATQQAQANPSAPLPAPPVPGVQIAPMAPAAPNTPEPNEKVGVITSFAPLVKRMIPAVVSVNVVQDVKVSGMFGQQGGGDDNGEGGDDNGGGGEVGPGDQGGGDQGGGGSGGGGADPFDQLRRYFGQGGQREYKQHGLGSGVIVSADGYILTNNHVVGNAEEIHVT